MLLLLAVKTFLLDLGELLQHVHHTYKFQHPIHAVSA